MRFTERHFPGKMLPVPRFALVVALLGGAPAYAQDLKVVAELGRVGPPTALSVQTLTKGGSPCLLHGCLDEPRQTQLLAVFDGKGSSQAFIADLNETDFNLCGMTTKQRSTT